LLSVSDDESVAIRVQDLHIRYRTVLDKKQTLRGIVSRKERERRARTVRVVHAVRGVTFDVKRGSVLGIVGPNGAGKSTLLRAIAGILPPEQGRIEVDGKVSTLLALGLGFNHALSGRENIEIGGLAAGLTRADIKSREEDIVDFAGIDDFIDMPMRTYSSGMKGRLAFAVSTSMSPDILLIDEALSAGDAAFKKKAADRMHELCGQDRTIVLVSHGLGSIRELADTAMWLKKGEIITMGTPNEVVDAYTTNAQAKDDIVANED
jgi:teichoic acid transport system ATP-binding protein